MVNSTNVVNKQQSTVFKFVNLGVSYTHFTTKAGESFVRVNKVQHEGIDITAVVNVLTCIEIEKQIMQELSNHEKEN